MRHQHYTQPYATTGMGCNLNLDSDRGFYIHRDDGNLDAPEFVPRGCSHVSQCPFDGGEYVVGGIAWRGNLT